MFDTWGAPTTHKSFAEICNEKTKIKKKSKRKKMVQSILASRVTPSREIWLKLCDSLECSLADCCCCCCCCFFTYCCCCYCCVLLCFVARKSPMLAMKRQLCLWAAAGNWHIFLFVSAYWVVGAVRFPSSQLALSAKLELTRSVSSAGHVRLE